MGPMSMLGMSLNAPLVCPAVTLTLAYCIESIVMAGMVMVMVVVRVTNVVMTWPLMVVGPLAPYSRDVTYWPGSMVMVSGSLLGGKTRTHGGSHFASRDS
jgi:hypothetical protein